MSEKIRVGIFGGTFNPPHIGHIESAKSFIDALSLDRLLIIPTLIPPHKETSSNISPTDRLNMCRLAFADIPRCEVSDIEIKRGGKSYTYMTLEELSSQEVELFMLCGTDMILTMDSWKNPNVIFDLAKVCYVRRELEKDNELKIDEKIALYKEKFRAEIVAINSSVIQLSSSEVREKISSTEPYDELVAPEVKKYIVQRELYQ